MTDQTSAQNDEHLIAEGVDEEPIESNRRLFAGWRLNLVIGYAALYAAFHMAALNGLSLSSWTGIELGFLPQFPMETWNFRIAHIAGALLLGFLLFNAVPFGKEDRSATGGLSRLALVLLIPALVALGATLYFISVIGSGIMAQNLSGGNFGLALLANAIATGAMLFCIITVLGPVSGAHFNPAVTLAFRLRGAMSTHLALTYIAAQVAGGLIGVLATHMMFDLPLLQTSSTMHRTGLAQWFSQQRVCFS